MEANIPSGRRPQDQFLRDVDPSNTEHRRALAQLTEGGILTKKDVAKVLSRLDPNDEQEMLTALVFMGIETPFELTAKDFDSLARKINPNTLIGSYTALLLESEDLLSPGARESICEKVDMTKIDLEGSSSEFGTTLSNLAEAGFLTVQKPTNPILTLETLTLRKGSFN